MNDVTSAFTPLDPELVGAGSSDASVSASTVIDRMVVLRRAMARAPMPLALRSGGMALTIFNFGGYIEA